MREIILASASPRRSELLLKLVTSFKVVASNISEERGTESASELVLRLSKLKAADVAARYEGIIIAADTVVALNDEIFGKPIDEKDAVRMLRLLSGCKHQVLTGVTVSDTATNRVLSRVNITDVLFDNLTDDEIINYVASGEPMDKAGAYAIQGGAAKFVVSINGSYSNVVGLPLNLLKGMLEELHYTEE